MSKNAYTPWTCDYSKAHGVSADLPVEIIEALDSAFVKENFAKNYARLCLIRIWTSQASVAMSSVFISALLGDYYRFKLFTVLKHLVANKWFECNDSYRVTTDELRGFCKRYRKSTTNTEGVILGVVVGGDVVSSVLLRCNEVFAKLGWDSGGGLDVSAEVAETMVYVNVSTVSKSEIVAHYHAVEKSDPVKDAEACWDSLVRFDMQSFKKSKQLHGRIYHPLSSVPSGIRQRFMMYGRPVVDIDDHASYWGTLVAYMPRCGERDLLIDALEEGSMYTLLYDSLIEGGAKLSERESRGSAAFKKCACGELIFTNWDAPARRSIRIAARKTLPRLSNYVQNLHRWLSPSQISRRLTAVEGQITLDSVYRPLRDRKGIHVLPYHDGVLCADIHADIVIKQFRKASKMIRGFSSLVRSKTADLSNDALDLMFN